MSFEDMISAYRANLPRDMTKASNFVLAALETDKHGRKTKIPYQVNGARASSTDPRTWASFEDALTALQTAYYQFAGLGWVLPLDGSVVAVDVDDAVSVNADGEIILDDRGKDALATLPDAYAEVSQSGRGLHLFTKGKLERGFNNRKLGCEMYSTGRFIFITGNALRVVDELTDDQAGVDALFSAWATQRKSSSEGFAPGRASADDSKLLQMALSRGGVFASLWRGEWQGLYPSRSEADAALCVRLAFWTEKDLGAMDRLFRCSGLMRAKWERADYRERTLSSAAAECGETLGEWQRAQSMREVEAYVRYAKAKGLW